MKEAQTGDILQFFCQKERKNGRRNTELKFGFYEYAFIIKNLDNESPNKIHLNWHSENGNFDIIEWDVLRKSIG